MQPSSRIRRVWEYGNQGMEEWIRILADIFYPSSRAPSLYTLHPWLFFLAILLPIGGLMSASKMLPKSFINLCSMPGIGLHQVLSFMVDALGNGTKGW